MSESNPAKRTQVLILDGGLGTTLEDVFHQDISHALWSAKPIDEDPEVIISAHLAFLRAGADVILTSSYQCAYTTFERAGYTRDDARRIMLKSVQLAQEARRRFREETLATPRDVKIALSLGPYGAMLYPAQEFDGFYPPPYGPVLSPSQKKTNAFEDTPEGTAQEQAAIDELAAFHYERLCTFADDAGTWDVVDFVAFETVPLRREIYAIRKAVACFGGERMKPWWISTDYPGGRFPETKANGEHLTATDAASAALLDGEETAAWGFGINCTGLEFLPALLEEARAVAKKHLEKHGKRLWLVLYPNRGDVYDPVTQSWRESSGQGQKWAVGFGTVVLDAIAHGDWEGVIAGGCCKTGPDEIVALAKEIRT
ncbi:Homocysteine S-methyltransferase [Trametes versicolor FP-101664 SS1]|uniref:Homocysteine S-methyltransferase n=1 Tax=Trametes versicolor (strain FP-101664) TaxID=717944 RepID=UPI0004623962|nr:Homocysteine S-methyltransferase [Trametes versicolor FP-101664 SS1]EIW62864.1 Homocysteine S-methyltransferase [Trametes versicolor FP-101664 SS1]